MSAVLESLLIGLIVTTATVYAVWALTPVTTRNRWALRLAVVLERHRPDNGVAAWVAARLRAIAKAPAAGCGNCSSHAATPAERASQATRDRR